MTKMICYDEFCGADNKIHLWSLVLTGLVIMTAASAVVMAGIVFAGLEPVVIPWYPTDF